MNPQTVPVEALLFDMDGVLVDSNPLHRLAWEEFNRRYGLETTEAMHQRMYGKRNDEIVADFFGASLPPGEVAARGRGKERLYRELAAPRIEEMLVPGIREFLARYHYLPTAVASNAEPDNVNFILDRAGLREFFHVAVDGHQVERPKPYPDIYLRAADLLGVPPAGCAVFEDSHSGAAAALAAGMRVIGVTTTHVNLPGTSITVDNFLSRELESWLQAHTRPF
ncbi:MAG: HAD family phosphatase [Acidobacteriota bacterium]|nr:HAD family phosphatase [Acidobacteriota bacterium]